MRAGSMCDSLICVSSVPEKDAWHKAGSQSMCYAWIDVELICLQTARVKGP